MVRVSGSRNVLQLDGIDKVLAEAESLLQGYQVGSEAGQSRLRMGFGAVGVNRALASLGAVGRLTITSRVRGQDAAQIAVQGGRMAQNAESFLYGFAVHRSSEWRSVHDRLTGRVPLKSYIP